MATRKCILLLVSLASALSCDDDDSAPSAEPQIEFVDVSFVDAPEASRPDTVKVTFSFTDGDGDLGLDNIDPRFFSPPYHQSAFFQTNGGQLTEVESSPKLVDVTGYYRDFLDILSPSSGDLVFPRTRKNPLYSNLLPHYTCYDYSYREFIVAQTDSAVLDKHTRILEKFMEEGVNYFIVLDTLYAKVNPNYYNIEVDFLVEQPDGTFAEYDFRKEFCATFDGRFPAVPFSSSGPFKGSAQTNNRGQITYNMQSTGFQPLFGTRKLKLSLKIRDRALHISNTIETPAFQL
jgi:hypothetical protein